MSGLYGGILPPAYRRPHSVLGHPEKQGRCRWTGEGGRPARSGMEACGDPRRNCTGAIDRTPRHNPAGAPIGLCQGGPIAGSLSMIEATQLRPARGQGSGYCFSLAGPWPSTSTVVPMDSEISCSVASKISSADSARWTKICDAFAAPPPNAQREGALCPLEKTRQRARKTQINHAGKSPPISSFSDVLTFYMPGEKLAACPRRADEALEEAKARVPRQSVRDLCGR